MHLTSFHHLRQTKQFYNKVNTQKGLVSCVLRKPIYMLPRSQAFNLIIKKKMYTMSPSQKQSCFPKIDPVLSYWLQNVLLTLTIHKCKELVSSPVMLPCNVNVPGSEKIGTAKSYNMSHLPSFRDWTSRQPGPCFHLSGNSMGFIWISFIQIKAIW